MADDGAWHLDKKVPVGLMIGLALNAGLGIWYASKLDSRVSYLETDSVRASTSAEKIRDNIEGPDGLRTHVTQLEGKTDSILVILRRWEGAKLDPASDEMSHTRNTRGDRQ